MPDTVKLNELSGALDVLDYPATREAVIDTLEDTVVQYADGEELLGSVVARSTAEVYQSRDDLESEIYANLPTEAVGEPGQAEGEG